MAIPLTVVIGPSGSGKTDLLLGRYRAAVRTNPPGAVLWLSPTSRAAAAMRGRLLGGQLDGCFRPGVMTFAHFAETILAFATENVRPISPLMKRHLIRQLIDEHLAAGRLKYFGPIAATSGLLDLVCEQISQWKRLEIWPVQFRAACQARGMAAKDRELLGIYEDYQKCLLDHGLYDAEGRFWSARDWLRKTGRPSPRLVVADGFADFTRTEHEILETLVAAGSELWITLPLDNLGKKGDGDHLPERPEDGHRPGTMYSWSALGATPMVPGTFFTGRSELFAKPLRTLAELRKRHADLRIEQTVRPRSPSWPAMAHIERKLFSNPRQAEAAPDTAGVEILAGGRQLGEIELIAARIKRLLIDGEEGGGRPVRPQEIAVVFRRPQEVGDLVGEVFGRMGIPIALECGWPLARSPGLTMLRRLLQLQADDWPMHDLLAVLGSNYFRPDWRAWRDGATAAAAERLIRSLQIPRGREKLLAAVAKAEATEGRDRVLEVLQRLAAALDQLPPQATLDHWGHAWQELAQQVGILRAMEDRFDAKVGQVANLPPLRQVGNLPHDIASRDSSARPWQWLDDSAWRRLTEALQESRRLTHWLGQDARQLRRDEALATLVDLLTSETVGPSGDESGRVRVLSAISVRRLRFPYLFVAGLCERSFPSPLREDRLYSEAESQRLIQEGLPLPSRGDRQGDEMLLFYDAITSATRRLWLSYPAVDESGEPLSPSPYLLEVEQACGRGCIPRTERLDLRPVPDEETALSPAACRIRAVAAALAGDVTLLAGLLRSAPEAVEGVLAGLETLVLRQDRRQFGPAEGMIGPAARPLLAAAFSPTRTFSATELEDYAYCPYRFFLMRLLRIEPLEDLELEVDYLDRGRLAHDLLAGLHRRVNQELGEPGTPAALTPQRLDRLVQETLQELSGAEAGDSVQGALREINRRVLSTWMAEYRAQHERYDGQWSECQQPLRPEVFEVAFGQRPREGDSPLSTEKPLEIGGGGQVVRLSGRIDRIDTGQVGGQAVFNILDYKTGGSIPFSIDAVARGTRLQLPLYALAAAELLLAGRRAVPWQAGYWYLGTDGFKPRQALKMHHPGQRGLEPSEDWQAIRSLLGKVVVALVEGMRQGEFPVWSDDADCTGLCPFHTVCRINQVRSLEKAWQPRVQ